MEVDNCSSVTKEDDHIELPPGFRFHPTDEELITHYLVKKVVNSNFTAIAIGEADLNKTEPWDLPNLAKMGEKECYFFVVRDRKYPTGIRTNRATEQGYWKATGKDKEIYRARALVGMKKTLVFYTGRAPKGGKTDWVMHEFRLEGKCCKQNLFKNAKNDWVITRVLKKNSCAKRPNFAEFVTAEELHPPFLPPLMDSSPNHNNLETKSAVTANPGHVSCFSNAVMEEAEHGKAPAKEEEFCMFGTSSTSANYTLAALSNMLMEPDMSSDQFMDSISGPDQSMVKLLLEGKESYQNKEDFSTVDRSNHDIFNNLSCPYDHDYLWNY